jgi:hypothetical protein
MPPFVATSLTPDGCMCSDSQRLDAINQNLSEGFSALANANAEDPGFSLYRNWALTNTKQSVKAGPGNVYGLKIINPAAVPVYVKFYDALVASVTVGFTTPKFVVPVPANDGTNNGVTWLAPDHPMMYFAAGITIACVTELADSGTSAPASVNAAEIQYK